MKTYTLSLESTETAVASLYVQSAGMLPQSSPDVS